MRDHGKKAVERPSNKRPLTALTSAKFKILPRLRPEEHCQWMFLMLKICNVQAVRNEVFGGGTIIFREGCIMTELAVICYVVRLMTTTWFCSLIFSRAQIK